MYHVRTFKIETKIVKKNKGLKLFIFQIRGTKIVQNKIEKLKLHILINRGPKIRLRKKEKCASSKRTINMADSTVSECLISLTVGK
jgi:hypothetical protein